MTLLEVLLAGVLFFGSSSASLLLWSRALASLQADARRAEQLELLEAELEGAESRLRDPGLLAAPAETCEQLAWRLVQAVERSPAPAGVTRTLEAALAGGVLRLRLSVDDLQRERSYEPAAFGGCSALPAAAAVAASDQPAGPDGAL